MPVKQVTTGTTEADFEARIDAAIRTAFPLLPRDSIRHQTKFSFSFGDKVITVDGKGKKAAQSRADIVLYFNDAPLAVLELKRPGLPLEEDDTKQGLSYAGVLNPRPPLVVVSNGQETRFVQAHSGQQWQATERSEQQLAELIRSAASAATSNLKEAISTLMGTKPEIWIQAVRQTTAATIADLTGDWSERLLPFVRDFQIQRRSSAAALQAVREGKRLVLVQGAPMAGKSNVLRELAQLTEQDDNVVVLFIEAEEISILQKLADTLRQALNWPVSTEEARNWLYRLSHTTGPKLVLAVDGIGLTVDHVRESVVDLTSQAFGANLALVLALDDAVARCAVLNSTGRQASAIGRRATHILVSALDSDEFDGACRALLSHRFGMTNGGQSSPELRWPWLLRAIASHLGAQPGNNDPELAAGIPPLLSVDLIHIVRRAFNDPTLKRQFHAVAAAALEDAGDHTRPISLMLRAMATYVMRRKTLKEFLSQKELDQLTERSLLKPVFSQQDGDVFVARLPELVASEAANVIACELGQKACQGSEKAAQWLSSIAASLPFGDLVAAQAIIDTASRDQNFPFNVVAALMELRPRSEKVKEGTRAAMLLPGYGPLHMVYGAEGLSVRTVQGFQHLIPVNQAGEGFVTYANVHAWLILSHLGGIPFAIAKGQEDTEMLRADPFILAEVGKCPLILRKPPADPEMSAVLVHELPNGVSVVCHKAGIVEPITYSLFKFLISEGDAAEDWVKQASRDGGIPMLARLDIALREMSQTAEAADAAFANRMLKDWVHPTLSASLKCSITQIDSESAPTHILVSDEPANQ